MPHCALGIADLLVFDVVQFSQNVCKLVFNSSVEISSV